MSEDDPCEVEGQAIGSPVEGPGSPLEPPGKVTLYAPGTKVSRKELSPEERVLADLGHPGGAPDLAGKGSFEAWCEATRDWGVEWQRWASYLFLAVCVEKVAWSRTRVEGTFNRTEANSASGILDALRCWALCPCERHLERIELPEGLELWTTPQSPVHNRRAWHALRLAQRAARGGEPGLLSRVGPAAGKVIRPEILLASIRVAMIPTLLGEKLPPFATDELRADPTFSDYLRCCTWSRGCESCKGWNLRLSGTHTQVNPASGDSFTYTRVACRSCNHSVKQSWEA